MIIENNIEHLRKRLIMRAEHRGIKEMDIILGRFVRTNAENFTLEDIAAIERMMDENDQALYAMITGHQAIMPEHKEWIERLQKFASVLHK